MLEKKRNFFPYGEKKNTQGIILYFVIKSNQENKFKFGTIEMFL